MLPELFRIGSFPVRTYGLLLMLGVFVGAWLAARRATKNGMQPEVIWDSLFWLVIPGILGARITYIAQNWSSYASRPSELFSLQFNGLTSFGGLIFGFLGLLVYLKVKKAPFWPFVDALGIPVLVGHAFGRVGCLLNGCCFGYPCEHGGFCVPVEGHAGLFVPAQLYDAIFCLILAAVLSQVERANLRRGASFFMALAGYGLSRFVYEFWRAGPETSPGVFSADLIAGLPITKGQAMALVFVAVGGALFLWRQMRAPGDEAPTAAA
jgi:phosphatidylglycerol---prolipoprotein diacylglyceryl transferase